MTSHASDPTQPGAASPSSREKNSGFSPGVIVTRRPDADRKSLSCRAAAYPPRPAGSKSAMQMSSAFSARAKASAARNVAKTCRQASSAALDSWLAWSPSKKTFKKISWCLNHPFLKSISTERLGKASSFWPRVPLEQRSIVQTEGA
eukprot:Skav205581  [mRNA]  locus=scaffold460:52595:58393:- [translate_table: standard]